MKLENKFTIVGFMLMVCGAFVTVSKTPSAVIIGWIMTFTGAFTISYGASKHIKKK